MTTMKLAEQAANRGDHGNSLNVMFTILQSSTAPILSRRVEQSLIFSLSSFASQLLSKGHKAKAIWLWETAIGLARGRSKDLYHAQAKFLCSLGDLLGALNCLDECLRIDPQFTAALDSSESIKSLIVDRWHFRMLNDRYRNSTYKHAIAHAIQTLQQQGHDEVSVLDIGGGTSILSVYAAMAGASHVYCCEMASSLAEIARHCVEDNGWSHKITVINKHSTDLQVGDGLDIPQRVHLVLTELVDSGLLGERIISSLRDARLRLLVDGGIIIPHSATVFGAPIESEHIAVRQRVQVSNDSSWVQSPVSSTDIFCNLAIEARRLLTNGFTQCSEETYQQHSGGEGPLGGIHVDETYTCEDLTTFPLKYLSPPQKLLDITLDGSRDNEQGGACSEGNSTTASSTCKDSQLEVTDKLHQKDTSRCTKPSSTSTSKSADDHHGCGREVLFPITEEGRVDGVAYWYTLRLLRKDDDVGHVDGRSRLEEEPSDDVNDDDSDRVRPVTREAKEEVENEKLFEISTRPGRKMCGWDQGIIYASSIFAAAGDDGAVEDGKTVDHDFDAHNGGGNGAEAYPAASCSSYRDREVAHHEKLPASSTIPYFHADSHDCCYRDLSVSTGDILHLHSSHSDEEIVLQFMGLKKCTDKLREKMVSHEDEDQGVLLVVAPQRSSNLVQEQLATANDHRITEEDRNKNKDEDEGSSEHDHKQECVQPSALSLQTQAVADDVVVVCCSTEVPPFSMIRNTSNNVEQNRQMTQRKRNHMIFAATEVAPHPENNIPVETNSDNRKTIERMKSSIVGADHRYPHPNRIGHHRHHHDILYQTVPLPLALGEMDIAMINDTTRAAAYLYGLCAALRMARESSSASGCGGGSRRGYWGKIAGAGSSALRGDRKGRDGLDSRVSVLELSGNWHSTVLSALTLMHGTHNGQRSLKSSLNGYSDNYIDNDEAGVAVGAYAGENTTGVVITDDAPTSAAFNETSASRLLSSAALRSIGSIESARIVCPSNESAELFRSIYRTFEQVALREDCREEVITDGMMRAGLSMNPNELRDKQQEHQQQYERPQSKEFRTTVTATDSSIVGADCDVSVSSGGLVDAYLMYRQRQEDELQRDDDEDDEEGWDEEDSEEQEEKENEDTEVESLRDRKDSKYSMQDRPRYSGTADGDHRNNVNDKKADISDRKGGSGKQVLEKMEVNNDSVVTSRVEESSDADSSSSSCSSSSTSSTSGDDDDNWGPFSVILCDLIEGGGLIRQHCLQELQLALQFMSTSTTTNTNTSTTAPKAAAQRTSYNNAIPPLEDQRQQSSKQRKSSSSSSSSAPSPPMKTIVVPYSVTVVVALVECPGLLSHHWVDPCNTAGVNVHTRINRFGSHHLQELDLANMSDLRFLCDPVEAVTLNLSSVGEIMQLDGNESEENMKCCAAELELEASCSGIAHAVCFWYKLKMVSDQHANSMNSALDHLMPSYPRRDNNKMAHSTPTAASNEETRMRSCSCSSFSVCLHPQGNVGNSEDRSSSDRDNAHGDADDSDDVNGSKNLLNCLDTGPFLSFLPVRQDRLALTPSQKQQPSPMATGTKEMLYPPGFDSLPQSTSDQQSHSLSRESTFSLTHQHRTLDTSTAEPSSSSSLPSSPCRLFKGHDTSLGKSSCTKDELKKHRAVSRHWRQAAVLLKPSRAVEKGDVVSVDVGIDLSYGVFCRITG